MSVLLKIFPNLFSILLGVSISWIFSHPKSPAKKKMPTKSAKNVHFFPNLKIHQEKHYYHIHHWMYFGIIYVMLFMFRKSFRGKKVAEGFILGLILQGLTYKDRFRVKIIPDLAVG